MEDKTVSIARILLNNKVCPHRPPSGKKTREKILTNYTRQLSSTSAKNYLPLCSTVSGYSNSAASNVRLFIKVDSNNLKSNSRHGGSLNALNLSQKEKVSQTKRRAQSAKARVDVNRQNHVGRTWSAKSNQEVYKNGGCHTLCQKQRQDSLEPVVYGYRSRRRICGSESDVSNLGIPTSDLKSKDMSQENILTDELLGVLQDDETEDEEEYKDNIGFDIDLPFPKTLQPLAHWWTPDVPPEYIGIDHLKCWVFLPSMVKDYEDLPVVPVKVRDPHEELPYSKKLTPPVQWVPKKYDHPRTQWPVDEWSCKHRHGNQRNTVPPIRIYTTEGNLLHETRERRTVDVIRREIEELECLMMGIGTKGGCSLVVQYQYEINQLQEMVNNTLGRVEEIERREREKLKAMEPYPHDYCGLKAFYKQHDEVIRQIRLQHVKCVRELAILERDLKIDSERAHFRKEQKQL